MKKFFNFIAWSFKKTDFFDRTMCVASFLMGASIVLDDPIRLNVFLVGAAIPALWALRWLVWVAPRAVWRQYVAEQNQTIDLLKKDYSNERRL